MVDIRPTRVNIQQRVLEKIHDGCAQSAVDAKRHVRCILHEGVDKWAQACTSGSI